MTVCQPFLIFKLEKTPDITGKHTVIDAATGAFRPISVSMPSYVGGAVQF